MFVQNFTAKQNQDNSGGNFQVSGRNFFETAVKLKADYGTDKSYNADSRRCKPNRNIHKVERNSGYQGIDTGCQPNHQQHFKRQLPAQLTRLILSAQGFVNYFQS